MTVSNNIYSNLKFYLLIDPVPDMDSWASTVQAAVTAIRSAGATSQFILLPGKILSYETI